MGSYYFIGNESLLQQKKTAFLCSRKVSASVVLKCYDWAIAQREAGNCVISGFHSQIEKDVLYYLLKGTQPIILALARGMKKELEKELILPIEEGRLLIITPFDDNVKRVTQQTSLVRNQLIIETADEIAVGYQTPGGALEKLLADVKKPKYIIG